MQWNRSREDSPRRPGLSRLPRLDSSLDIALKYSYVIAMKRARIAELKNRLSHYLRFVRRGESVLVYDRDRVIARIEPIGGSGGVAAEDPESGAIGYLRPPAAVLPRDWRKGRVRTRVSVLAALLEERESGR